PDLDLGPPGSLYSDIACVRCVLGSGVDLLWQEAVWLYLDGVCDHRDHDSVVSGVAASLLHDGFWRQRQLVFRYHDDDYFDPDRSENFQLVVHHVPRSYSFRIADDVDHRVHDYL